MCDELLTRRFFNDKRPKRDDGNGHLDMSVSWSRPSLAHCTRVRDPIHPSGCRRAGQCQILVTEHAVAQLDSCAGAGSFAGEPSRRGPARPMTGCPRVTSYCQHPDLFGGRPGVGTTGAWGVPDTRCQIPPTYQTATDHRFVNLGDDGFGLEVVVVVVVVLHLPC
ncbi:hypothetical protein QR685DRAFT_576017 [Neurospora intermedia]|uniref:Uncharacterized protein n=1 Tax=Neurospora intermedia TaxID=5142 RepID=A0ABR3CYI2_NEUIN